MKGNKVTHGELICYFGLWFFMAAMHFSDQCNFWSMKNIDAFCGAPHQLGSFMSRILFEQITLILILTDRKSLPYVDKFWEVRQLMKEWNKNMFENFLLHGYHA
mmetsp:Transcript_49238/g.73257  ORF Transcript_49238/g.73257 Transcript_49238/m.73257 type:complete len:104 (-) Transcript_49238:977-1288(-)